MTAYWFRAAACKRFALRGLILAAASSFRLDSNSFANLEQKDEQLSDKRRYARHVLPDPPVIKEGTYLGNHKDMKSGEWKRVELPEGLVFIFKVCSVQIGFGKKCRDVCKLLSCHLGALGSSDNCREQTLLR